MLESDKFVHFVLGICKATLATPCQYSDVLDWEIENHELKQVCPPLGV